MRKDNYKTRKFFDSKQGKNFYVHSALEKEGKIASIVKLEELMRVKTMKE